MERHSGHSGRVLILNGVVVVVGSLITFRGGEHPRSLAPNGVLNRVSRRMAFYPTGFLRGGPHPRFGGTKLATDQPGP